MNEKCELVARPADGAMTRAPERELAEDPISGEMEVMPYSLGDLHADLLQKGDRVSLDAAETIRHLRRQMFEYEVQMDEMKVIPTPSPAEQPASLDAEYGELQKRFAGFCAGTGVMCRAEDLHKAAEAMADRAQLVERVAQFNADLDAHEALIAAKNDEIAALVERVAVLEAERDKTIATLTEQREGVKKRDGEWWRGYESALHWITKAITNKSEGENE